MKLEKKRNAPAFMLDYVNYQNDKDENCELMLKGIKIMSKKHREKIIKQYEYDCITVDEAMRLLSRPYPIEEDYQRLRCTTEKEIDAYIRCVENGTIKL